ncbi:MAG: phage tail tape measure protein [Solibacillus sp.]|uniref:phage tail tape measure protein n=1 Tax=Solibacillus sp. TaxID=1909654 RepID=UPI0033159DEB
MAGRVISAVLKFKDENFSSGLRRANSQAGDFGRAMNVVQNKVENFNRSATRAFKAVGVAAKATAATGISALAVSVGKSIIEMDESFNLLQAQTGASAETMKEFESTAKNVFSKGYGEGLNEVTSAIATIKQNMHSLNSGDFEEMTKDAMAFSKIFDEDINDVTRASNNMMSAFGVTAKQSMDMFTTGAQRGLNFSKEMLDNTAEYAPLFGEMGYSAEQYFGILERGSKAGVYNLDYVNDVMKEFQIRIKDGSKSTDEAMSVMSKSTFDLWEEMNRGEATISEVAGAVVSELKGMEDQVTAGQLAVSLFGTKWEDLESTAMYAMLGSTDAMTGFEGAMDSASASIEKGFKNRLISSWRKLQVGIGTVVNGSGAQEFLNGVATKADELAPKIVNVVERAFELGNTIKTHWVPIRETVVGITVAVGAFKAGMTAMSIVSTITGFVKAYRAAVVTGTTAQWALNTALTANPIGVVIMAVAGLTAGIVLLYRNSDKFRQGWDTAWSGVKSATASSVNFVVEKINDLINILNKIPGVNIPIVPKVQWGNVTAGSSEVFKSSPVGIDNGPVASYDVGSNRITHDQFANIHKDEMILPARQAQRVRAAGGNIDNIDSLVKQQSQVVNVTSGQGNNEGKGSIQVIIENIHAAGVTVAEVASEIVTQLKFSLANM